MCAVAGERVADRCSREHLTVGFFFAGGGFMNKVLHLPTIFRRHLVGVGYFVDKFVVLPLTKVFIATLSGTARLTLVAGKSIVVA